MPKETFRTVYKFHDVEYTAYPEIFIDENLSWVVRVYTVPHGGKSKLMAMEEGKASSREEAKAKAIKTAKVLLEPYRKK